MTKIVVIGGSGYAGSAIVAEAAARGHQVVSVSRSTPSNPITGVEYHNGSATDAAIRQHAFEAADVIVGTVSPRGDMTGKVAELYKTIAGEAAEADSRFVVVGGFGSLRPAEGAPRFVDGDDFPADYKPESLELASVLDYFQTEAPASLDWLYVSPAAEFGGHVSGEKTGKYRLNGPIAVFDENGQSKLSSQDLAVAIVDEIEAVSHPNQHISVAY